MISKIKFIELEISYLEKNIKFMEKLKNEEMFKEIANLDIHVKMDKKGLEELIEIIKTDIDEIDRQYKKFNGNEIIKELDYWRERAVCELAFLYVLRKEYKEAVVLIKEEFERNRSLHEEPMSNFVLSSMFFRRSKFFLREYEYNKEWESERLARGIAPSSKDKNVEWLLRAAFVFGKCLNRLWKDNNKIFIETKERTEEETKEDSGLIRKLMDEIKNIEGKIV